MKKRCKDYKRPRFGQTILEYAILVTVVAVAIIVMHGYLRSAVKGKVKQIEIGLNEGRVPSR